MLGCSSVDGVSNALDILSVQRLSNPLVQCLNMDGSFPRQHMASQYQARPLLTKELMDSHGNALFLGHSSPPQFLRHFGIEATAQAPSILAQSNFMPSGMHAQSCSPSHPGLQQCLSTNSPTFDVFDAGRGVLRGCFAEEKFSSNDKSSGSSSKSTGNRSRWKPNPHQLEVLEDYFDSGATRASAELYAAVLGCGHATEHNINVWLKNRSSRKKKPTMKKPCEHRKLQAEESDDDWQDFKSVSRSVMDEVSSAFCGLNHSDVLLLARAIREARHICCYGVGKEALAMKAFASGLHHLGFASFFIDDTNMPKLDNTSLVLVSAGPSSPRRVSGMMDEAIAAGSRVFTFATYKQADCQRVTTIQIPTEPQSPIHFGSDGEAVSSIPDPPYSLLNLTTIFDLSVKLLCDCVCVMLKRAGDVEPAEIRARHTNLE